MTIRSNMFLIGAGGLLIVFLTGCQQQMARIFHTPEPHRPHVVIDDSEAILAADLSDDTSPTTTAPSAVTKPSTQPASATGYTAPSRRLQAITFASLLGARTAAASVFGAGTEAGEASISATRDFGGAVGAAGLGATLQRTIADISGQPGLQRGFAAGLRFAGPNTILRAGANPLSGQNGRCSELVRAGLFPNQAACQRFFGKK